MAWLSVPSHIAKLATVCVCIVLIPGEGQSESAIVKEIILNNITNILLDAKGWQNDTRNTLYNQNASPKYVKLKLDDKF